MYAVRGARGKSCWVGVGGRASPEILGETDARVASPWKGDLRGSRWLCDASASSAYFHTQKPSNPQRSFLPGESRQQTGVLAGAHL